MDFIEGLDVGSPEHTLRREEIHALNRKQLFTRHVFVDKGLSPKI